MFLIVPYAAPSDLKQRAYISYLLVLVCIVVFYFQFQNKQQLSSDTDAFCQSLEQTATKNIHPLDKMHSDVFLCSLMIKRLEQRPDLNVVEIIREYFWFDDHSQQQIDKMASFIKQHYAAYSKSGTAYLTKELMYYPSTPELLKIVSSSFAHGDIWHLLANLVFLLAFAPAVELLLARAWLFLLLILISMAVTMFSYTASVLLGADALPALGLSGVVMAMMGLHAALMPRKKVRLFVWLLTYIRHWSVPAWMLVLWYIGFDLLGLILGTGNASINLVAHVSGGISGFLIGVLILKKYYPERKLSDTT